MEFRLKNTYKRNLTHSRAHYLWAVHELNKRKGYARATDVASLLGVSRSAVSLALSHLKSMKLVKEKIPEHYLFLTQKGEKELDMIETNFHVLSDFFHYVLNLDEDTSIRQACLIEHLLLEEVASKLKLYLGHQKGN